MRRIGVGALALAAAGAALWWFVIRVPSGQRGYPIPGEGERTTLEVYNASGQDGLARRVTRDLRHHSFDVVYFGTAPFDTLTTSVLKVRRGDTLQAAAIREVLGTGVIVIEPDPHALLDVSVYLGRDVRASGEFGP